MDVNYLNHKERINKEIDVIINWSVTNYCNFSCPGCIANAHKIKPSLLHEKINTNALLNTLQESNKKYKLVFSGGEPLLVENIMDTFGQLTKDNYITLISNLTQPKVYDFGERINPERVEFIKASAHILELEKNNLLNTFIDHHNFLVSKGFNIIVEEVAYPVMADKVERYKEYFKSRGVVLNFQAFRGLWKGKKYPEAYTNEEYEIYNFSDLDANKDNSYHRKNLYCNAGYNSVVAYSDGSVFRCYNLTHYLGNLYTGFKLKDRLIKCPLDSCQCPLSEFDPSFFEKALLETELGKKEIHNESC